MVTLDTWVPGWRPRDLASGNFPQLRGKALANYTSDPVFQEMTGPDPDPGTVVFTWVGTFGNPLTWDDLPWLRSLTYAADRAQGHLPPRRRPPRARRGRRRHLLLQPRRPPGQRRGSGARLAARRRRRRRTVGDAPVVFDSGVRTGADVVKALALGATAVAVGRPYVYGLALGGVPGAVHVLRSLLAEADLVMGVDGYPTLADLTRDAPADDR